MMRDRTGLFLDRRDAGRQLGARLTELGVADPVVLALPRGGAPVAFEIARALNAPLDVLLVCKIGFPRQPELALGAIVEGATPTIVKNDAVAAYLEDADNYLAEEAARQLALIEERRRLYRGDRVLTPLAGKAAIVVDDGIATGASVEAALTALRRMGPREIVLAVPVAPEDAIERLRGLADRVVCLATPEPFYAVGQHYRDFTQTEDREVIELLNAANIDVAAAE